MFKTSTLHLVIFLILSTYNPIATPNLIFDEIKSPEQVLPENMLGHLIMLSKIDLTVI